jgi:ketosteroid isomerase-like protein
MSMKELMMRAGVAFILAGLAGPAAAGPTLPKGATIATDAKALKTYTPDTNPGRTDFDVADRAAIANLIDAYAFAYDNAEAASWFSLFTGDAVFVAGQPGQEAVAFTGDGFRTFWTDRLKTFSTSGNVRRHLMSNILFLEETADTAHVSVVGLLTNAKDGKTFSAVSSLNYEGWLVKGPDGWKIQRWHDFPDADVGG